MATVRIVTDSSCDLPSELIGDLPITVLPNRVQLDGEWLVEGIDLAPGDWQARSLTPGSPPALEPPDLLTFTNAYASLSRGTDGIISIHSSARLSNVLTIAGKARGYHYDRTQVLVVDSESATMGLGYIVLQAAQAAQSGGSLRDILDLVRTIIHQTHVIFVADAAEAPLLLGRSRPEVLVGTGGGTAVATRPVTTASSPNGRPVLKLEEGRIVPLEHVRNRTKALERLYEFVEIFPKVEQVCLVHGARALGDVEWLLKRIDPIFPRKDVRVIPYGPAMIRFVGHHAIGVVAYEGAEPE